MILVRDIFQIDPNHMKPAKQLAKEGQRILRQKGYASTRVMTDLTGDYYTLVLEGEYSNLGEFEQALRKAQADRQWQAFYPKLRKLIRGGRREIFSVVE